MGTLTVSKAMFRYCDKCRTERQVDGETLRCLTCGMQTKYSAPPSQTIASPNLPEQSGRTILKLGDSRHSRQWIEHTRQMADTFAKGACEAEARAAAATAEAERLRKAANAFFGLLKQVDVEEAQSHTHGHATGRWSRNFDACIECGTTEIPHAAHGLCRTCDGKRRYAGKA